MKTKTKNARPGSERKTAPDYRVPDSPQNAFIEIFRPIRSESWPNVACSYLFTDNENNTRDHFHR